MIRAYLLFALTHCAGDEIRPKIYVPVVTSISVHLNSGIIDSKHRWEWVTAYPLR